jgi:hypothetical protein
LVARLLTEMTAMCTELRIAVPAVQLPEKPPPAASPRAGSDAAGKD